MSLLRQAERCIANQNTYRALNAFVPATSQGVQLQEAAREAEQRLAKGTQKSQIDGRLIAIKDNICTGGEPTTCASAILDGFQSPFPATVVERLRNAGALIAGKTNMDEFGMGSHSTNSSHGVVKNVYSAPDGPLSAGGSSGGSAVAVATQQCFAALGTDTGGSVRLPAAYTGILGFKPSYGLISRWGVIAYANSLDTVGILAGNAGSIRAVFDIINAYDERDPTSISQASRARMAEKDQRSAPRPYLRIGVPLEYHTKELDTSVRQSWASALSHLESLGHTIHPVSLPSTKVALASYYVLAPAEASSNLAKYDGVRYGRKSPRQERNDASLFATTRGVGLGDEVKRRILLGSYTLSSAAIDNYFLKAQKIRRIVQEDFNRVFALPHPFLKGREDTEGRDGVDILLSPTAQSLPPKLSEVAGRNPVETFSDDILTVPASLAGLPALSVPTRLFNLSEPGDHTDPSMTGLQLIGQYGSDDVLLNLAEQLERG